MESTPNTTLCPKCSTAFTLKDKESILFVCPGCDSVFNKDNVVHKAYHIHKHEYGDYCKSLPLGTIFRYKEIDYTVTGKIVKIEAGDRNAVWAEYFLTNEAAQNIYLSEYNGHWNVIEYLSPETEDLPTKWNQDDIEFRNEIYVYFHKYGVKTVHAEGEFNFNPFEEGKLSAHEYINPPYLLILERKRDSGKLEHYHSTYLYPKQLSKKLKGDFALAPKVGIAGSQPFYWDMHITYFRTGSVLIAVMMVIAQLLMMAAYPELQFMREPVETEIKYPAKTLVAENLKVTYDNAIMDVKLNSTGLYNDWAGADMALINDETGEERYFSLETEYYTGVEGGESWSEGSTKAHGTISHLAKGTYHMEITPVGTGPTATYMDNNAISHQVNPYGNPVGLTITATIYKGSWSIVFAMGGVLLAINIIFSIAQDYFNHKKWGEDYDTFEFLYE